MRKSRKVKILSSELIFKGRVFDLKRDKVIEPSGVTATREIIEHKGSVVVLPLLPDGRIVLINQYRYAARQPLWELVAGHKEPDESFEFGAHRELEEEAGYKAGRMRKLLEIFPSPGLLGEKMVIFLADKLRRCAVRPEDDEKITRRIITLREAETWIRTNKIRDSKTIAGILYFSAFVARKGATAGKRAAHGK